MSSVNATVEMLIRKPAKDVFDAFANPRTIEKFWLKNASGPLAKNATVEWEFMVQGARETVPQPYPGTVTPAKAGVQCGAEKPLWIPAFAGMT